MHVIRDTGVSLTVILHKDDIKLIKTKMLLGINPIVFQSKLSSVSNRTSRCVDLIKLGITGFYKELDPVNNCTLIKLKW